jgi:hypothetical protein
VDGSISVFSIPGATEVLTASINRRGTIVGSYYDISGVRHGFVRDERGIITIVHLQGSLSTTVVGVSDSGVAAGYWFDGIAFRCFSRSAAGVLAACDPPRSTGAQVTGVSAGGTIVGSFNDLHGGHGFLRLPNGAFTVFDVPSSAYTMAEAINRNGTVVGSYVSTGGLLQGFIRHPRP